MSNDEQGQALPPDLPPEIAAQVAKARAYQRTATALHHAIENEGIEIQDLSIAFSDGLAVLSGIARSQTDSDVQHK